MNSTWKMRRTDRGDDGRDMPGTVLIVERSLSAFWMSLPRDLVGGVDQDRRGGQRDHDAVGVRVREAQGEGLAGREEDVEDLLLVARDLADAGGGVQGSRERVDDHVRDGLAVERVRHAGEAGHEAPGQAGVGRAVDAGAVEGLGRAVGVAGADVNRAGVVGVEHDRADEHREVGVAPLLDRGDPDARRGGHLLHVVADQGAAEGDAEDVAGLGHGHEAALAADRLRGR